MSEKIGYVISSKTGDRYFDTDSLQKGEFYMTNTTQSLQEAHVFRSATDAARFLFAFGSHQLCKSEYDSVGWTLHKVKRVNRLELIEKV